MIDYQAWNFLETALQSEGDKAILKRCRSPREVFEFLGKWYDPENEVATQPPFDKFHEFSIPQNSNPITALHDLDDIEDRLAIAIRSLKDRCVTIVSLTQVLV